LGRWKFVTKETRGIVQGLYGKTPTPIDPEVKKTVLKKGKDKTHPEYTERPGDVIAAELDQVIESTKDWAKTQEDQLICALFPQTGKQFCQERDQSEG
jgi:oxaloacetate decarboxylase alpha subunit